MFTVGIGYISIGIDCRQAFRSRSHEIESQLTCSRQTLVFQTQIEIPLRKLNLTINYHNTWLR